MLFKWLKHINNRIYTISKIIKKTVSVKKQKKRKIEKEKKLELNSRKLNTHKLSTFNPLLHLNSTKKKNQNPVTLLFLFQSTDFLQY